MNVVLIGFRCSGKTTTGRLLAKRLKYEFVDTDDYVEEKYEMTIREMFDKKGESWFRLMETDAIEELSKLDNTVIATGGGVILKYKNIQNLKKKGALILLQADPKTIYERAKKSERTLTQRPPLTTKDMYTEIKEQMEYRKPYYLQAANYIINTSLKSPRELVNEILELLNATGNITDN